MPRIAFLFPGQGSQAVGMGKYLHDLDPELKKYFDTADRVLEYKLSWMCFEGPEEELKKTENTQPALYLVSSATLHALREEGIEPFAVAGHSLGEYTALHAASVFDFETGLLTVRERGLAFAAAGAERPGAMAAILGLPGERVAEICAEISDDSGIAVCANYNEPSQTVISGDPSAVERARSVHGRRCKARPGLARQRRLSLAARCLRRPDAGQLL